MTAMSIVKSIALGAAATGITSVAVAESVSSTHFAIAAGALTVVYTLGKIIYAGFEWASTKVQDAVTAGTAAHFAKQEETINTLITAHNQLYCVRTSNTRCASEHPIHTSLPIKPTND